MLESQRQSDAPDVAWCRLLDLVDASRGLPEAFPVAPRLVRHSPPAPRQARCHYRREKDPHHHRDTASVLSPARAITLPLQMPSRHQNQPDAKRPAHPETSTHITQTKQPPGLQSRTQTSAVLQRPRGREKSCQHRKLKLHELWRLTSPMDGLSFTCVSKTMSMAHRDATGGRPSHRLPSMPHRSSPLLQ